MAGLLWGIYVRTSDDSREGAGLGVKRQEKDVRAMIPRIDPEGAVVEVYVDNDLSAYSGKPRKEYVRMCGDVITGRITAIGAWHNDRLHRPDLRELEDFIDLIEANKTRVATVKAGEMDPSTPTGRLVTRELGVIARFESEHKADRIRSKHIELAAAGKSPAAATGPTGTCASSTATNAPTRSSGRSSSRTKPTTSARQRDAPWQGKGSIPSSSTSTAGAFSP